MKIYDAAEADLLDSQRRDPLLRHLTKTLIALARRHQPPPARGLDLGCGVGRTTLALARAGYEMTGVDPSPRAIEVARDAIDGSTSAPPCFEVGDATAASPAAWRESFDFAVCSEVIEHVSAPDRVIDYLDAVLRPGGTLLLTTPHDRRQWTVMDDYAGHVTRFTVDEVRGLLDRFEVLDLTTEGFPFQRLAMWSYDRSRRRDRAHEFASYGHSLPYRAYVGVMPLLLDCDHLLRRLRRGTTVVATARKH
jgi:SAM-dependent methyltransferase